MASNAITTQGTLVQYLKTPPTTYAAVGEVYSFTGPGGKAATIDVTNLLSVAKEKLPGLPDDGQFSMSCNFAGTDLGQQDLEAARLAQAKKTFKVTLTDGTTLTFDAYVMEFSLSAKADSKVELTIGLETTGPVAYAWATMLDTLVEGEGLAARDGRAA